MTPRNRFISALQCKPLTGLVPHFELVFYLTMEAFGKVHPSHRNYGQWFQMTDRERHLHRMDMANIYVDTAERYNHSAIFLHPNPSGLDELLQLIDCVREISGDTYFLMIHGDATYGVPSGSDMMDFIERIADEPEKVKQEAEDQVNEALTKAEKISQHGGLDGFALCTDYCFNTGPFLSPNMFSEYVTPYLARLTRGYRDMGFYVIKHTDGNIMPILDQLVDTEPHALHSLDPQGDVDLTEVKSLVGDRVCLIGNVHCGFLQTGTEEEVVRNVSDTLKAGMSGEGYIFSTSNCVYTGLPLARYELMHKIWMNEGVYPGDIVPA
jgi:uroporphyrinogen decarboxylase